MLSVFRQRNFALLWLGQVISIAGDWVLFIGLPFYVYELTGSTLATGGMFLVQTLPRILLSSPAGVFVDRWDRKRTMIAADLLRAALLLALLAVESVDQLWLIYTVAVLQSTVAQFFVPAKNALLPHLVDPAHLVPANSMNSLGESVARLVAPALGGAMMGALGLRSVVLADSASFLFSALLLALISTPAESQQPAPAERAAGAGWSRVWQEWLAGLRAILHNRAITALVLFISIAMLGEGILDVLLVPFVRDRMQGDSLTLGWMMSAQAAGSIAGGLVIGALGKALPPKRLVVIGALGWGLFDLAVFNTARLWVALPLLVLVGIPIVGMIVSSNAWLQRESSDEYRGRVFGTLGTTMSLTLAAGMSVGSLLGDRLGIVAVLNVACVAILLAALVAQWLLPRAELPPVEVAATALPDEAIQA